MLTARHRQRFRQVEREINKHVAWEDICKDMWMEKKWLIQRTHIYTRIQFSLNSLFLWAELLKTHTFFWAVLHVCFQEFSRLFSRPQCLFTLNGWSSDDVRITLLSANLRQPFPFLADVVDRTGDRGHRDALLSGLNCQETPLHPHDTQRRPNHPEGRGCTRQWQVSYARKL